MQDILNLDQKTVEYVDGSICINYKDKYTGKIKEQIKDKNHSFLDSFQSTTWAAFLNNVTVPNMFITDDNSPQSDSFPWMKGNIIGWGQRNQSMQGNTRGAWIPSKSYIGINIDKGKGQGWKFVYEFGSLQILTRIGSVGVTTQYDVNHQINRLGSVRGRRIEIGDHNDLIYKNNLEYRISNLGIITIFNPFSNEIKTIDISSKIDLGTILRLGFDYRNNKSYIWSHFHNIPANRKIYEFFDETFDDIINIYEVSNIVHPQMMRYFIVYNNYIYYYENNWCRADFINNINSVELIPPSCVYRSALLGMNNTHWKHTLQAIENGTVTFINSGHAIALRIPFYDMKNEKFIGSRVLNPSAVHIITHTIRDPLLPNKSFIMSDSTTSKFHMHQALCAFSNPDNAPDRPPGTTIEIDYTINVMYA